MPGIGETVPKPANGAARVDGQGAKAEVGVQRGREREMGFPHVLVLCVKNSTPGGSADEIP